MFHVFFEGIKMNDPANLKGKPQRQRSEAVFGVVVVASLHGNPSREGSITNTLIISHL
jgi:hypothetical protein